jgi:inner membrane protein
MEPTSPSVQSNQSSNRLLFKGLLIGGLVLLLLIPAALLNGLVSERAERQQQVVAEVSSKWAGAQTLIGPIVAVPFHFPVTGTNGKQATGTRWAYFLPNELRINGQLTPELRHRSLYTVLLYRSRLKLEGRFLPLSPQSIQLDPGQMDWSGAQLLLGLDDGRGLEEEVHVTWNGAALPLESGMPENEVLGSGLHTSLPGNTINGASFSIDLQLKGSTSLYAAPVGKTTSVTLTSPWNSPAFDGQYLPTETKADGKNGFIAQWKVLHVSRPYPQAWKASKPDLKASAFGVRLVEPAGGYAKTERSVKYAILFIALTFAVFFFIEALQHRPVHPLQYLLVGLALCVFYTLLLSISEYTGFNAAYGIATVATVTLIGLYTWGLFNKSSIAAGFSAALAGLYGFIYVLIQQEDRALLFGSIGLFAILAVLMYFSRKIDWYGRKLIMTPAP